MKKLTTLALILFMPFLLTACTKKPPVENSTQQNTNADNPAPNVFTTVRDAVTKSIGLKCEYTDEDGDTTMTYIKGGRVYLEGESKIDEKLITVRGILRDENFYVWGSESAEGLVIKINDPNDDSPMTMGETEIHSIDDVINKLEENKDKCAVENIADSKFDLPANIKFMEF